jgi:hypothetical protein
MTGFAEIFWEGGFAFFCKISRHRERVSRAELARLSSTKENGPLKSLAAWGPFDVFDK